MDVPVAANVLGTLGAICWSVQLVPQIILNHRRHNAAGLQPTMMMFWAWAGVSLGVYNISSDFNKALWVQPQILTLLSLITWTQCYHYESHWSVTRCVLITLPIACVMAGIELALFFALDIGKSRNVDWPLTLMAVLAAAFLALGVLRHYYDIWQHKTVRGISFIFVGLDAAGDLTSLLSLLFQPSLDTLGFVIYGIELVLWLGIFACGGYFNLIPWLQSKWSARRASVVRAMDHAVSIHDMPSSTSVFRTPSAEHNMPRLRATTAVDRA